MRGKRTTVTIRRRVEGAISMMGEATETWEAVTGGKSIRVHIQPLFTPMRGAMAAAQAVPGQIFTSSHLILFRKNTDIKTDDRIFTEPSGNQYVVQNVNEYAGHHTEATVAITNIQR